MGLVGDLWGGYGADSRSMGLGVGYGAGWICGVAVGLIADLWGWEWVMGLLRADLWGRRCVGPLGASAGREERREGIIGVN